MPQVQVWNDNVHVYKEQFREQSIVIPPKGFILMDEGEAHTFKCSFAPIKVDHDGQPVAEGFKMIRIAPIPDAVQEVKPEPKVNPLICVACKYEAASEKDLSEHQEASHASQRVHDEEAEKFAAAKKKKAG